MVRMHGPPEETGFHWAKGHSADGRPRTGPCLTQGMRVIDLIRRLRDEFTALPGLRLTEPQVERLFAADLPTATAALHGLVSAGFLMPLPDGRYARTDLAASAPAGSLVRGRGRHMPGPWRRILCPVDLERDTAGLSTASHTALRYAARLAVTHRARVTALHVISPSPSGPARTSVTDRLTKRVSAEPFRRLIDVRVASGSPNEEVMRVARDIDADLIVIGRHERPGGESSLGLPDILRQTRCPVLIVHPSGQAAVA